MSRTSDAGSGEHGVDAVAIAAREIVAAHAVILLEVADDGFDGGATAHLAADCLGDTPDLATDPVALWQVSARRAPPGGSGRLRDPRFV